MTGRDDIRRGRTSLGIELGSTRIKACLIGADAGTVLAVGTHEWENRLVDGHWTYSLEDVERGVQAAFAAVSDEVRDRYGVPLETVGAIGVSAMMHGYLAFDSDGDLLVPFRTWRDTTTGAAAAELTALFGVNIPLRWSIAHLHQAVLDREPHVPRIASLTSLAGYVHRRLTGRHVLGIGDASGMFPIDTATGDYDERMLHAYDTHTAGHTPAPLRTLLPDILPAGTPAGTLTPEGATFLDPHGTLRPGIPLCPPEGDAGTGMIATNTISPRTGNVSAGTSIFAMVVLERPLTTIHHEIDLITTPAGDPVALVHCNNGASELAAWAGLFTRFAAATGHPISDDTAFDTLFREALTGEADAGGLLAYNYLAGEPITGLDAGRPLFVRTPDSTLTLANFMRAQLYGVFATLTLGMHVLAQEGVTLDHMFAHGGLFRTTGVAQRFLAAALGVPVAVGNLASEGGAWGIAILASYLGHTEPLTTYLNETIFTTTTTTLTEPHPTDTTGYTTYLTHYQTGLTIQTTAVTAL